MVSNGNSKTITTGYIVTHAVVAKTWTVQVFGVNGLPSHMWNNPSSPNWASSWAFFYTGGGFANVSPGSSVIMSNGGFCYSGAPGENF